MINMKNFLLNSRVFILGGILLFCPYMGIICFADNSEKICVKDLQSNVWVDVSSNECENPSIWMEAENVCIEKEADFFYALVFISAKGKDKCEPIIIPYSSEENLTREYKMDLVMKAYAGEHGAVDMLELDAMALKMLDVFHHGKPWDAARYLKKNNGKSSGTDGAVIWKESVNENVVNLCRLGLLISFMMIIIQIVIDFTSMVLSQGMHPITVLQKNIVKIIIVAILLTPGIYKKFMGEVVAPITDSIANMIWVDYTKRTFNPNDRGNRDIMVNSARGLYGKMVDKQGVEREVEMSPAKVIWGKDIVVGLFSCLIFTIASVLTLIFPILQSAVFIVAFYLGPLCVPFVLLDVTSGIFKNWVSFVLTVCFWAVVGSLVFWIGTLIDVQGGLLEACMDGSFVTAILYGLLSIFLFIMSYPIAASIFGSGGGAMGIMSGVAGMVGMVSGGAIVGSLLLGGGSKILGYGSSMAGWTLKGVGMKSTGQWLSKSAKSMDSFGGGMINSAVEQSKKASGERVNLRDMGKAAGVGGSMLRNHRKVLNEQKARVADLSSNGVKKAKDNWNSAIYNNLREAAERHGYDKEELATVQFDSSGENIVAASMDTGEQFRVTEDGGFELVENDNSDVTRIASGLKLSAADKRDMREMSSDMLKKIKFVGSPIRDRVNETLAGTGFNVRDIASVQMSRDGDMMGLTMKGGEQFAYNDGNLESRL